MEPTNPSNQPNSPEAAPTAVVNPTPEPVVVAPQPIADTVPPTTSETDAPTPVAPAAPASATAEATDYISNPFLNAVRGLIAMLKYNPVPVMVTGLWFLVAWLVMSFFIPMLSLMVKSPIITIVGAFAFFVAAVAIYGAYIDIAGKSALNQTVTTKQALQRGFQKILPLLGLAILMSLVIGFGFLLLIIPGIIFAARLSLSPLVMFEENLGIVAAMKRSSQLTKGHVNEMLGAWFAGSLLGGQGLLMGAIGLSPLVGRYHDLKKLQESGAPKPKVHWLNYLYLIMPVVIIAFVALYIAMLRATINTRSTQTQYPYGSPTYRLNTNSNNDYFNDTPLQSQ